MSRTQLRVSERSSPNSFGDSASEVSVVFGIVVIRAAVHDTAVVKDEHFPDPPAVRVYMLGRVPRQMKSSINLRHDTSSMPTMRCA